LESEPNEALRRAYRYGSWDVFAGQYFGELCRQVHFIEPFDIPGHWIRFGAYDYGFNHPAAFGWFTVNEDGEVFLYRELVRAGLRVDEFCAKIGEYHESRNLLYIQAGWDCWAKKGTIQSGTSPTISEEFQKHGIFLTKAKIDRVQGAFHLRNYLAIRDGKPRFYIFNTCPISFDCLSRMEHDPDHVEDVLKVDATDGDPLSGDDAYDMIRYGLMSRPPISPPVKVSFKFGTKEHSDHFAMKLEENLVDKLKKEKENKDGQGIHWEVDKHMTPPWLNWEL
jgi:hypothetical protein